MVEDKVKKSGTRCVMDTREEIGKETFIILNGVPGLEEQKGKRPFFELAFRRGFKELVRLILDCRGLDVLRQTALWRR